MYLALSRKHPFFSQLGSKKSSMRMTHETHEQSLAAISLWIFTPNPTLGSYHYQSHGCDTYVIYGLGNVLMLEVFQQRRFSKEQILRASSVLSSHFPFHATCHCFIGLARKFLARKHEQAFHLCLLFLSFSAF